MENQTSTITIPDRLSLYGPGLKFWFVFIEPWFLFGGILGNLAILFVMPRKKVNINKSMKVYYIIIAFFDLYNLVNSWILWTFISDSMCVITNCQFFYDLAAKSELACKEIFTGWTVAEIVSNYTLVAMLIEKTIVVLYPLKAKGLFTSKTRTVLYSLTVLPPLLAVSPFNPFVARVLKTKFNKDFDQCYYDTTHPLYEYVFWSTHIFMFGVHEILSFLLSTTLTIALLHQARERTKLIHKQLTDTKELGSVITILILGIINFLTFIPVTFLTFFFFLVDSSIFSDEVNVIIDDTWRITYQAVVIVHAINFLIYFMRIKQFRRVFIHFFQQDFVATTSKKSQ